MAVTLASFSASPTQIAREIRATGPAGTGNAPGNIPITSMSSGAVRNETIMLVVMPSVVNGSAAVADNADYVGVTVTAAPAGGDCLWLPWGSGKAYLTQLNSSQDLFFTWTLNGCGILISGPRTGPTVVHANADIDRLAQAVVMNDPVGTAKRQSEIYGHFYKHLLATLVSKGHMPKDNSGMLLPETYLGADSGRGAVFGVRTGSNWTFYWNARKRTKQLWPVFEE